MHNGLIKPNQCRYFGVKCVNEPTDHKNKMGIYANNMFLQLCMKGTNCLVEYFYPSNNELRQFPWVFTSYETSWDP